VTIGADGREVLIQFHIDEGPQVTVSDLRIVGHQTLPEADIRAQFLTQPHRFLGVFSKGLFIEKQLDKDLEAVQFLYRRPGFLAAAVSRELRFSAERATVSIHVMIEEGFQTHVGSMRLQGAQTVAEPELRSQLTLRLGDPFDEKRAQDDVDRLLAVYERRGYR